MKKKGLFGGRLSGEFGSKEKSRSTDTFQGSHLQADSARDTSAAPWRAPIVLRFLESCSRGGARPEDAALAVVLLYERAGELDSLLRQLVKLEVNRNENETIWREDNATVALLKAALQPRVKVCGKTFCVQRACVLAFLTLGWFQAWFRLAAVEVFRKVVSGHVGIADERVIEGFCMSIVKGLRKSSSNCPPELLVVLNEITLEASNLPWARCPGAASACALSFLSLQIITPVIVNPRKSEIVLAELSIETLQVFARLGKCFQSWANEFQMHGVAEPELTGGALAVRKLFEYVVGKSAKQLKSNKPSVDGDIEERILQVSADLKAFAENEQRDNE